MHATNIDSSPRARAGRHDLAGFTLFEAMMAMMVAAIFMGGLASGYMQAHRTAEWSAYSLAANSLAMQPLEQFRGAKWDPYATPPVDQLVATNFPITTNVLDVPISGTNIVYGTNRITIRTLSTSPPLKQISVETTWRFHTRGVYTNRLTTYRTSDQ